MIPIMSVEDANGTSMDATHYSPEISAGSPTQPIPAILDEVHQLAVSELDTAPMPAVDAPAVRTLPVLSTPKTSEYVPPVVTTKEDITRALNSSLQEGFMTLADSVEKAVAEGDPAIAEDAIFTKDTKRVVTRAADFFATRPDLLPENFVW